MVLYLQPFQNIFSALKIGQKLDPLENGQDYHLYQYICKPPIGWKHLGPSLATLSRKQ